MENQPEEAVNKSNKLVSNQEHGFVRNLASLPPPEATRGPNSASALWKSKTYKETKHHYESNFFQQYLTEKGALPVLGMFRTGCLHDEKLMAGIDPQFLDTLLWPAAWSNVDLSPRNKLGVKWASKYQTVV